MSLINSILSQEKLNFAVTLYNQYVPKLTHRNKVIAISTAVVLYAIMQFREKVLKPPRNLRHVPHVSTLVILKSLLMGESYWDRSYRKLIPLVDAPENNGIYLVIYL